MASVAGQGGVDRIERERPQVNLAPVEREQAPLGLGDEEQIADEVDQPVRAALDRREVRQLVGGQIAGVVLHEQLQVADDRRRRGPQLVRHDGDEVVPQPDELVGAGGVVAVDAAGAALEAGTARSSRTTTSPATTAAAISTARVRGFVALIAWAWRAVSLLIAAWRRCCDICTICRSAAEVPPLRAASSNARVTSRRYAA